MATLEQYRNNAFVKYCESTIEAFLDETHGVKNVLLSTPDGFEITSKTRGSSNFSADNLAAVASTIFSLGTSVGDQLGHGTCHSVTIDNDKGKVYISSISGGEDKSLILLIESSQQTMLAHILHGSRKLAESIGKRLSIVS